MKKVFAIALLALMFSACTEDEFTLVGVISGTVTDINTTEPIQGAKITLSPTGKSTVTGSDGQYEFVDLEPKQYKIQAQHVLYKTDTKSVTVVAGESSPGDMQLTPKD